MDMKHKRIFNRNNKTSTLTIRTLASVLSISVLSISLTACGGKGQPGKLSSTDYAMGTVISQNVYTLDWTAGSDSICQEILNEINRLEQDVLSVRYEDSEISKINALAGSGSQTTLSEEMSSYMTAAIDLADISGSAFDPAIGKLIRLWDIDGENPHKPDDASIISTLLSSGISDMTYYFDTDMNPSGNNNEASDISDFIRITSVALDKYNALDFGAIGKGIACDNAEKILSADKNVSGAIIAVGGSILVYGEKNDGKPWEIAIQNPRSEENDEYLGSLRFDMNSTDSSVSKLFTDSSSSDSSSKKSDHKKTVYLSTSGDYEKYFEQDGVRYHHILDPSTGYPADSGLISATIVCDNGLLSDGLSTACFVLGIENSLPLLDHYNAGAVFVDKDHKVTVTDNLKDVFELKAENFTMK